MVQADQGMIRSGRFHAQDIQADPGKLPRLQGLGKRGLVDQGPPAGIDQDGTGLHQRQPLPVDQSIGPLRQGAVDGNDIAIRQQGMQFRLGRVRAGRQDLHPEGLPDTGDRLPDRPKTNDPQGQALEFHQGGVPKGPIGCGGPAAVCHRPRVEVDALGDIQDMGKDRLGHGGGAVRGHIANGDIPFCCSRDINHVVPGSGHGHELKVTGLLQGPGIQRGFVRDGDRGTGQGRA